MLVVALSGCASWFARQSDQGPVEQSWRPCAVVEFSDLTGQDVGTSVSRTFWNQARADLADAIAPLVPRPAARLAPSWLKAEGTSLGVPAFLTGTISGYRVQAQQHRAWVSMTVRLVAADSGRILWSKRLVATEPLDPQRTPADAFERAVRSAAREFTHELQPPS